MTKNIKQQIEKIFRESASANELFDSFEIAIKNKLKDLELYKILLANTALNADEIKMFAEKLSREFSDLKFDIYMWAADILESSLSDKNIETAFDYYHKACQADKTNFQPYLSIIKMYNPDLDIPPKHKVIHLVEKALNEVKHKSILCRGIAEFYGKLENMEMKKKYLALAAKFARKENG